MAEDNNCFYCGDGIRVAEEKKSREGGVIYWVKKYGTPTK